MAKRGFKVRVLRPEIRDQIEVNSPTDATIRRFIAGENTSSFYSQVYRASGNGKGRIPQLDGRHESILFPWGEERHFRPDVVHKRKTGHGYTEVKAVSTHTSQPHCSVPQFEDYAFALLNRIEHGDEIPWIDYAVFRYGKDSFRGQHKHDNGDLIERLSGVTRDLTIIPFNLALFVFMNSPEQARNQQSSWTPTHQRGYYDVRGRTINFLQNEEPQVALEKILDSGTLADRSRKYKNAILKSLHLRELEVTRPEPKPMETYAGDPVAPFQIARFRLPDNEYQAWKTSFFENHPKIMRRLGARDLYQELQEHGGEITIKNSMGYIGNGFSKFHDDSFDFGANVRREGSVEF